MLLNVFITTIILLPKKTRKQQSIYNVQDHIAQQDTRWLVTGGAGFIGSHFVDLCLKQAQSVFILDALKYSGHPDNIPNNPHASFIEGDICDQELVYKILSENNITHLVNFAAESHVDNSIHSSAEFIQTNIEGTRNLLEASRRYIKDCGKKLRYIQVSTDEVFGSLSEEEEPFTESSPVVPNSPYSASKAAADMLVNAWHHTYGLDVVTTHCSNNYGPRQHPEKLIPHMITQALNGKELPVYGDGRNIRDWIHVKDHAKGVYLAALNGKAGEHYCFGGACERRNLEIVHLICDYLDHKKPRSDGNSYTDQIKMVTDRLGHDYRYAINDAKAQTELGFQRAHDFEDGLNKAIEWYLNNAEWVKAAKPAPMTKT